MRYKGEDALAKKYDEDLEKYFERGREKEEQHEHTSDDAGDILNMGIIV